MSALGAIVSGRLAWIIGIIVGVILLVIGIATSTTFLILVGAGLAIFGTIFLIISIATKGKSD